MYVDLVIPVKYNKALTYGHNLDKAKNVIPEKNIQLEIYIFLHLKMFYIIE